MKSKSAGEPKEWFEDLFPLWRPFFDRITPGTTRAEVNAAVRLLALRKGQQFLDCPCGIGRIAVPLAKRGIRVTGIDITREFLAEVQEKIDRHCLPITLHECDMRRIKFVNQFDAAGNLWTSFGYFGTDEEDMKVLKNIFRALKPGGKFLLHLINRDWIIRHFRTGGWEKTRLARYHEKRHFDMATSRCCSDVTFYSGKTKTKTQIRIRMYSLHELIDKLTQVGFADIQGYGGFHGEPITMNSRMMWIIGTKPKR